MSQSQKISSHLEKIWGTRSFPRVALLNLVFLQTWVVVLGESLELPKGSKPLVVFDGKCGMDLESMQGNRVSSRVAFGYIELFHVAVVTSGSL